MKQLIPLSYLNEACDISENLDEKKIKIHLKRAQANLKDILGYNFYQEIETQYEPKNDTFTTANATLYEDYIKDYLAWRTFFFYLGFSQSASTPTGIRQFEEESSTILEDVKLFSFEKNVEDMTNFYRNELINFLRLSQANDSTAYPLWVNKCEDQFSWGITAITRDSHNDKVISINKTINANE